MKTLGELIDRTRLDLADVSVGVRRSWEELFKYTLRHYPGETFLADFDLESLAIKFSSSDINPAIAEAYVKRWRDLLNRAISG